METYLEPVWILDWSKYPLLNRQEFHLLNQLARANRQGLDYHIICHQNSLQEFEADRIRMLRKLRDYGFINWKERHLKRKLRTTDIIVLI